MACILKATQSRPSGDDRRAELLGQLAEQVETLTSSEGWRRWLETAARFHTYSINNQLLIAMQRPDATRVAGYRVWQGLGRQVRKGERGIAILAPVVIRDRAEASTEVEGTKERGSRVCGFRVVHVFDLAQTDGAELPEVAWPVPVEGPKGLYDQLRGVVARMGLTLVEASEGMGSARGWYDAPARTITVVDGHPAASKARTLLHELAHSLDPACNSPASDATRAEKELLAESVAFVVGKQLGLDTDDCSAVYTASWGADRKRFETLAGRVLQVARALAGAIGVADVEEVAA